MISGRGSSGRFAATRRSAAAGTFSNSQVATSTLSANRATAAGSLNEATVTAAETCDAGESGSLAKMWVR
ncbi:hypothetical protein D3C83_190450 [compost metagenome]